MTIEVVQGSVYVNAIWALRNTKDTLILECDLKAKYAEVEWTSNTTVALGGKAGDTLHLIPDKEPTEIHIKAFEGQTIWAHVSRYTLMIFVLKSSIWEPTDKGDPIPIWSADD